MRSVTGVCKVSGSFSGHGRYKKRLRRGRELENYLKESLEKR